MRGHVAILDMHGVSRNKSVHFVLTRKINRRFANINSSTARSRVVVTVQTARKVRERDKNKRDKSSRIQRIKRRSWNLIAITRLSTRFLEVSGNIG